jgi:uncharacterized protein YdeI (YjbR/CyaY-like superfamily)
VTDQVPRFQPTSRAAWRAWLRAHHAKSSGVWLVFLKGAERQLPYADSVEEALCYGWIDSTMRPMDGRSYRQLFTPRKPKSTWSALNKRRAADLIAQRRMRAAGLAAIELAKRNGSWTALDAVEALVVPPDLARALAANTKAKAFFDALAPSSRKGILYWISGVKSAERRAARIAEAISQAAKGLRPRHHEKYRKQKAEGRRKAK